MAGPSYGRSRHTICWFSDGGGQGKGTEPPLDPVAWLHPGGLLVIDDFTPLTGWPPRYAGEVDVVRQHWLATHCCDPLRST
jgi:hypothetical protein